MPNVKIYVDESLYPGCQEPLTASLRLIRDMLCAGLKVEAQACQLALIPVGVMSDLPRVNIEMSVMPRPDRRREAMIALCNNLRKLVEAATSAHVAMRVTTLDPETYIALK